MSISWLKDGRAIDTADRALHLTQVDQFNSILLIESLSPEHNGNYSCVARNLAARVTETLHLVVNGKLTNAVHCGDFLIYTSTTSTSTI